MHAVPPVSFRDAEIQQAMEKRDKARAVMAAATPGSRKWLAAEAELNFWQGKVAHLELLATAIQARAQAAGDRVSDDQVSLGEETP
jgi:hypothetical protein